MTKIAFPHREFTVDVYVQPDTGLRMAVSKSIPGFSLAAKSDEEMDRKLAPALEEFLVFSGYRVGKIHQDRTRVIGGDFRPNAFSFFLEEDNMAA